MTRSAFSGAVQSSSPANSKETHTTKTKFTRFLGLAAMLTIPALGIQAAPIPLNLPRPDGQPGNPKRPVKVYILAGQSNMVGMGDLTGARPPYPSVLLSADPAIIPGVMPIGGSAVARHGVYDAKAAVYEGSYDPAKKPVKTMAVALGTVAENLPAMEGSQTVTITAQIGVPTTGNYTVHAGFENSTHCVVLLDGKEVYRREIGGTPVVTKIALEQGKRYPVTITYFKGGSAAFWLEQVELPVNGDLVTITKRDRKFSYLIDDAGNWTVRNDVYFQEARLVEGGKGAPLSAEANKKCLPKCNSIGPEVGFGYVMGTFHDEQVLLIKTSQGNRSLRFDFRPPSSGNTTNPPSQYEGAEYRLMVKGVHETLDNIAKIVPGYVNQGYEMAGFVWFQGHKDSGSTKEDYEKCLVNLINDLRKEFKAPKMPAVVATVGFHGYRLSTGSWQGVWEAQMAVGDPKQHPEYAGNVSSVDTRDFWREEEESPRGQDYHYNRNAETYLLVGEAMGRAMVRLEGGEAEAIPKSDREARVAAALAAEVAKPEPSAEQKAAHVAAIKPLILDGALAAFTSNPRNLSALQAVLKGTAPARNSMFLNDILDDVVSYYQAAGVRDYDWKSFGGDSANAVWEYFSFDLPNAQSRTNGICDLKEICPAGATNWFATNFDTGNAGWKSGAGPFGVEGDEPLIPTPEWYQGAPRSEPRTAFKGDVLLMRRSFDLPPLKAGYRYRIRIGGSIHANAGEGYAIYINGKLLADNRAGLTAWRKTGHLPRGSHVWADFRDEFKGGKVTLAIANFPMNNRSAQRFIPAREPLIVWMEEQKLPPVGEAVADTK